MKTLIIVLIIGIIIIIVGLMRPLDGPFDITSWFVIGFGGIFVVGAIAAAAMRLFGRMLTD